MFDFNKAVYGASIKDSLGTHLNPLDFYVNNVDGFYLKCKSYICEAENAEQFGPIRDNLLRRSEYAKIYLSSHNDIEKRELKEAINHEEIQMLQVLSINNPYENIHSTGLKP